MYLIFYSLLITLLITLINQTNGENTGLNDEIHSLPGLEVQPKFRHYSGYLNATEDKQFHYWFIESQSNPKTDPVILWLNGGPGCSSLGGLFEENGPFRVTKDGKNLTYDEIAYSWNSVANVIYLESPAGAGYSYRKNSKNVTTNDDQTAKDNYLALLHFFEKFPQFKQNDFYMTGESYAGVYIPTLALEILKDNSKLNLKGVAIGNGYFNLTIIQNSRFYLAHNHGLIDTETWNQMSSKCCSCNGNKQECNFMNDQNSCQELSESVLYNATKDINQYSIYDQCYHIMSKKSLSYSPFLIDMAIHSGKTDFEFLEKFPQTQWYDKSTDECVGDAFEIYLNIEEVRDALHIPKSVEKFSLCNYNVFHDYKRFIDVKNQFMELLTKYKLDPFIIYNGDTDLVCDFIGNQMFLDGLQLPVIEKYKKWTYNGQTAGFVKRYRGLTFITVKGAGHMVPKDKPGPAFHLINYLIGKSKLN